MLRKEVVTERTLRRNDRQNNHTEEIHEIGSKTSYVIHTKEHTFVAQTLAVKHEQT